MKTEATTLPAVSAQIHVPDVSPRIDEKRALTWSAARAVFGSTLPLGTFTLAYLACTIDNAPIAVVLPATWALATVLAALAAVLAAARVFPAVSTRASCALLFGGIAMAAPLSLHQLFVAHRWAPDVMDFDNFGQWVAWSALLVGHTHVLVAALCAVRGYRGTPRPHFGLIYAVAVVSTLVVNCFIWRGLGVLPALYVAVTAPVVLAGLKLLEERCRRDVSDMSA